MNSLDLPSTSVRRERFERVVRDNSPSASGRLLVGYDDLSETSPSNSIVSGLLRRAGNASDRLGFERVAVDFGGSSFASNTERGSMSETASFISRTPVPIDGVRIAGAPFDPKSRTRSVFRNNEDFPELRDRTAWVGMYRRRDSRSRSAQWLTSFSTTMINPNDALTRTTAIASCPARGAPCERAGCPTRSAPRRRSRSRSGRRVLGADQPHPAGEKSDRGNDGRLGAPGHSRRAIRTYLAPREALVAVNAPPERALAYTWASQKHDHRDRRRSRASSQIVTDVSAAATIDVTRIVP